MLMELLRKMGRLVVRALLGTIQAFGFENSPRTLTFVVVRLMGYGVFFRVSDLLCEVVARKSSFKRITR